MANKSDDSSRPQADDPKKQPQDAESAVPGTPKPSQGSDSAIDLGELGEGDLSGISVIEWASLVESEPKPPSGSAPKFDSPSDRDMLGHLGDQDQPGGKKTPTSARSDQQLDELLAEADALFEDTTPPKETASAIEVVGNPGGRSGSESAIDLNVEDEAIELDEVVQVESRPSESLLDDEVVDLGSDALLEDGSQPSGEAGDLDAIDLEGTAVVPEHYSGSPEGDSAIELGEDAFVSGSSDALARLGQGTDEQQPVFTPSGTGASGVDLGNPRSRSSTSSTSESEVNLLAEDILREEPSGTASSGGSSRDLIAEGLESGVDLLGTGKGERIEEEDVVESDFFNQVGSTSSSSSVDLGSMHSIPVMDDGSSPDDQGEDSSVELGDAVSTRSASEIEIDLDKAKEKAAKKAGKAGKKTKPMLDADEAIEGLDLPELTTEDSANEESPSPEATKKKGEEAKKLSKKAGEEKLAQPKGRTGAFVGGGTLGFVAGAAAFAGIWFAGLLPGENASPKPPSSPGSGGGASVASPVVTVTFEKALQQIRNGDLDKIDPQDLQKVEESKPEQLVARAEYHWLLYRKQQKAKDPRAALQADAEPVKLALADLEKAMASNDPQASADALFVRGQIHEETGNLAGAKADYSAGVQKFAADPQQKLRFETALQVMELTRQVSALTPAGMSSRSLALILFALQAPAEENTPATLPTEAGYSFWQALKQAKAGNFAQATKLLDEARTRHDLRRFHLPRKPQNPASDPREEIFLRCCDALKDYWSILARLNNPNYLTAEAKERLAQVDALLAKSAEQVRQQALLSIAERLAKGKSVKTPEDLEKILAEERKLKDATIANQQSVLSSQKKELDNLADQLKQTSTTLSKTQEALTAARDQLKLSQANQQDALTLLKEVGRTVGSDFSDLKNSKDSLLKDIKEVARLAKTVDPKDAMRELQRELAEDRAQLAQRWEPQQMLPVWLALLDQQPLPRDLELRALKDADRVQAHPKATPEAKAQAQLIRGLVLRNQDNFAEALPVLKKACELLKASDSPLLARAESALQQVTHPAQSLALRAANLEAMGKRTEAMAVLDRALKLLPERKGMLHVQRAKLAFETARAKGSVTAADLDEARKEAQAAASEGLAEGEFLLGRIEEELGKFQEAEKHYRAAIKAHDKLDEEGCRYRMALARVLLRVKPIEPVTSRLPSPVRTGKAALSLDALGLLLALTLQAPSTSADRSSLTEAERLADEILALGDKAPFDVRAQALAVKGLHTRALNVYVNGLREKGALAPEYANTLRDLLNNHPTLRRPESLVTPDPLKSEKHYASGLNFFFARRYPEAERELLTAIEHDNGDARYYYFLGLARLAQGKREAREDFDQAARLEDAGRPDRAAVSAALERIQGQMRRALNEVRSRPLVDRSR